MFYPRCVCHGEGRKVAVRVVDGERFFRNARISLSLPSQSSGSF